MRTFGKVLRWCLVFFLEVAAIATLFVFVRTFLVTRSEPPAQDVRVGAAAPQLVFAVDSPTEKLPAVFTANVIAQLQRLHAGLALATADLSPGRAQMVRQLNAAGIPVTAGLTVPPEQGLYLNASNAPQAAARFTEFQAWTQQNGLQWARIGLDIEPSLQEFNAVLGGSPFSAIRALLGHLFDAGAVARARAQYAALIARMHAAGYPVETYQFPFLADARKVHTTLLERLFGIVDVHADREAFMTYTSFHPSFDSALIWAYAPEAQAAAVGSTSGDREPGTRFGPLTWDAFVRDVKVASHFSPVVGVYSLEGCLGRGFLERLETVDWSQPVTIPAAAVAGVEALRARIQSVLWTLARLPYIAGAILLANLALAYRRSGSK